MNHVVGGTHHSLMVEMKDYVVVFDAPVSDRQSNLVLSAARAKYLRKPVKYIVLTHHHMDHAGGLRAYVAEGATLVVGKGAARALSQDPGGALHAATPTSPPRTSAASPSSR